jgi:hypothetical protein
MPAEVFQVPRKKIPHLQHSHKFVKEQNACIVREIRVIPGDS